MFTRLQKRLKDVVAGDVRVGIWEPHRLLYVRVAKSGNGSILAAIPDVHRRRLSGAVVMRGYQPGWTLFSFVRNPWARLVSVYSQKVGPDATSAHMENGVFRNFRRYGIPIRPGMSFEEFCELVCAIPDYKTEKHLRSQAFFLVRAGKVIVPFVGRVESMSTDWTRLMDRVGLDYQLPHLHRTKHKHRHYSHYYRDNALVNLVGDRYADDARYFDYDFERE